MMKKMLCLLFLLTSVFFAFSQEGAVQENVPFENSLPQATPAEENLDATKNASGFGGILGTDLFGAFGTESVADGNVPAIGEVVEKAAEEKEAENNVLSAFARIADKIISVLHVKNGFFENNAFAWFIARIIIAVVAISAQIAVIKGIRLVFSKITAKTEIYGETKLKPLKIKTYRILDKQQMLAAMLFIIRIAKYLVAAIFIYFTVTLVLGLFAPTQGLALKLLGYIWNPLKSMFFSFIDYIDDIIFIAITIFIAQYISKMLKYFAMQIEQEKIVFPGFYADWARPTYNLLQVLIIAFTVAVVYPHLPNSGTASFQGVSMLLGLIISLGSSSAISNLVAGIVLTYMRSFKLGDFIKLNETTGFVVEKTAIVTRLRTVKNEYITFPNVTILTSSITNYNTSADVQEKGLIIHKEITMGYDVPWRTMHKILIDAALKTENILSDPPPFVNQTALDDFFCRYEINAYTKAVERLPRVYTDLFKNIQDGCSENNVSLYAPHFMTADNVPKAAKNQPLPINDN